MIPNAETTPPSAIVSTARPAVQAAQAGIQRPEIQSQLNQLVEVANGGNPLNQALENNPAAVDPRASEVLAQVQSVDSQDPRKGLEIIANGGSISQTQSQGLENAHNISVESQPSPANTVSFRTETLDNNAATLSDNELLSRDEVRNTADTIYNQKLANYTGARDNGQVSASIAADLRRDAEVQALAQGREWGNAVSPSVEERNTKIMSERQQTYDRLVQEQLTTMLNEYKSNNPNVDPQQLAKVTEDYTKIAQGRIDKRYKEWGYATDSSEGIPDNLTNNDFQALTSRINTLRLNLERAGDKKALANFDQQITQFQLEGQKFGYDRTTAISKGLLTPDLNDRAYFVRLFRKVNEYYPGSFSLEQPPTIEAASSQATQQVEQSVPHIETGTNRSTADTESPVQTATTNNEQNGQSVDNAKSAEQIRDENRSQFINDQISKKVEALKQEGKEFSAEDLKAIQAEAEATISLDYDKWAAEQLQNPNGLSAEIIADQLYKDTLTQVINNQENNSLTREEIQKKTLAEYRKNKDLKDKEEKQTNQAEENKNSEKDQHIELLQTQVSELQTKFNTMQQSIAEMLPQLNEMLAKLQKPENSNGISGQESATILASILGIVLTLLKSISTEALNQVKQSQ